MKGLGYVNPMKQICELSQKEFEITQDELGFLEQVSPVFDEKKFLLPAPKISPQERLRRRLALRNLRYLYKRNCDLSSRSMISFYPPDAPHKVYYSDEWWGDSWDPLDYGRDFDFSQTFFEQFSQLYRQVPTLNHYVILSENCEYINGAASCRNCYLCFNLDYCEDCCYLDTCHALISCFDCLSMGKSELCYECLECEGCYSLFFSSRCVSCSESYFLKECRSCRNCIACSNLVNKEYYIFNQPCSKEEFEQLKQSFASYQSLSKFAQEAEAHHLKFPRKYYFGHSNEGFSGDNIQHLKNSYQCFDSKELENCKYCFYVFQSANCMDYSIFGDNSEWIYNCTATGINCSNNICCFGCWSGSSNNQYCILVNAVSNCFGCCSLKQKQFCILNKQYSEAEYHKLAAKVASHMQETGEWGQFFPASMSPFPYNETVAFEIAPLSKADALARGYTWSDKQLNPAEEKTVLPDSVQDADQSICQQTLHCQETGKAFKIIPQELSFHKKMGLALPRLCPDERHAKRLARRNPRELFTRNCQKSGIPLQTSYQPNSADIVYSEEEYLKALT